MRAGEDRRFSEKRTDVRAWISAFQNTKRAEMVPKSDIGVIVLRWRVGVRVFGRRCFKGDPQNAMLFYRPPCSRSERSEASVAARGGGYQVKRARAIEVTYSGCNISGVEM